MLKLPIWKCGQNIQGVILNCDYKLFSGLNILDSRLRGSDGDVGFVIPAEAGGKRPTGDSDPVFIVL